mmetsp:Transcript_61538/g.169145  ORF Transcript_61538/g.169145 Transcript_61538/m.169145 type:complete len:356 (+) Transcript_61538:642-1709(+)
MRGTIVVHITIIVTMPRPHPTPHGKVGSRVIPPVVLQVDVGVPLEQERHDILAPPHSSRHEGRTAVPFMVDVHTMVESIRHRIEVAFLCRKGDQGVTRDGRRARLLQHRQNLVRGPVDGRGSERDQPALPIDWLGVRIAFRSIGKHLHVDVGAPLEQQRHDRRPTSRHQSRLPANRGVPSDLCAATKIVPVGPRALSVGLVMQFVHDLVIHVHAAVECFPHGIERVFRVFPIRSCKDDQIVAAHRRRACRIQHRRGLHSRLEVFEAVFEGVARFLLLRLLVPSPTRAIVQPGLLDCRLPPKTILQVEAGAPLEQECQDSLLCMSSSLHESGAAVLFIVVDVHTAVERSLDDVEIA